MFWFLPLMAAEGLGFSWALRPGGMSTLTARPFTVLMSGFVHGTGVVRTVGRDRREGLIYLLKQGRDLGRVMRPTTGQIRSDDLTRTGINSEMQLPPSPVLWRFSHMTDMNSESCTVDEQVERSICRELNPLTRSDLSRRDSVV